MTLDLLVASLRGPPRRPTPNPMNLREASCVFLEQLAVQMRVFRESHSGQEPQFFHRLQLYPASCAAMAAIRPESNGITNRSYARGRRRRRGGRRWRPVKNNGAPRTLWLPNATTM